MIECVLMGIRFEPNSDTLLSCDDWPAWLADGVNYLQKISKEEKWVSLLVHFVELEQLLDSAKIVSWYLP
jgi:hypothetical protein